MFIGASWEIPASRQKPNLASSSEYKESMYTDGGVFAPDNSIAIKIRDETASFRFQIRSSSSKIPFSSLRPIVEDDFPKYFFFFFSETRCVARSEQLFKGSFVITLIFVPHTTRIVYFFKNSQLVSPNILFTDQWFESNQGRRKNLTIIPWS